MQFTGKFRATRYEFQHWFLGQLSLNSSAYIVPVAFLCNGEIDVGLLGQCIKNVLGRHDIFSATYHFDHGELWREYNPSMTHELQVISSNRPSHGRFDEEGREEVFNALFAPFSFEEGPLVRCCLVRYPSEQYILTLAMHHIIADLETVRIVLDSIAAEYNAHETNGYVFNKDIGVSYREFAKEHNEWLASPQYTEMLGFWKGELDPVVPVEPLFGQSNLVVEDFLAGDTVELEITKERSDLIESVARQLRVNSFTITLAVYYIVFSKFSKNRKLVIGVPFSNRRNERYSETCGEFANILPVVIEVPERSSFTDVVKMIRRKLLLVHRNQEMPLDRIAAEYKQRDNGGESQFYQIGITMEPDLNFSLSGVAMERVFIPKRSAQLDVYAFFRNDASGDIRGYLEYRSQIGHELAETLASRYVHVVDVAGKNMAVLIDDIKIDFPESSPAATNLLLRSLDADVKKAATSKKIVVASTFTAEPLKDGLSYWIDQLNLDCVQEYAPYGQVMQQLLNPASELRQNGSGYNVILLRLDDLIYSEKEGAGIVNVNKLSRKNLEIRCDEFCSAVADAAEQGRCRLFVILCPSVPAVVADSASNEISVMLQNRIVEKCNKLSGVRAVGTEKIMSWYPINEYHDQIRLQNGHIPYTEDYYLVLSTVVARKIFVSEQKPVKVIAVDCDNTLWQGVAGEDGPDGVIVSENHQAFQRLLKEQVANGRLLTVVSKNNPDDVLAVFRKNRKMILSEDDFYSMKINWEVKSKNIAELSKEINVGLDGFLMIDDNPVECAEVASVLSDLLVARFPEQFNDIPSFLSTLWMLDFVYVTVEDKKRAAFYEEEKARESIRKSSGSFVEFLEKLSLMLESDLLNESNMERLSQLTFRTNQFNATGQQHTPDELYRLRDEGCVVCSYSVKDRYGDYGTVGLAVYKIVDHVCLISQLLLSCRVLGRGVEQRIVKEIASAATEKGCRSVGISYRETGRNKTFLRFLEGLRNVGSAGRMEDGALYFDSWKLAALEPLSIAARSATDVNSKQTASANAEVSTVENRNRLYGSILDGIDSLSEIKRAIADRKKVRLQAAVESVVVVGVNDIERSVAAIWSSIINVQVKSYEMNFYDLGGTSMQLPQVLVELRKAFNFPLTLVDLFKYTTVKTLATYIASCRGTASVAAPEPKGEPVVKGRTIGENVGMLRQRQLALRNKLKGRRNE